MNAFRNLVVVAAMALMMAPTEAGAAERYWGDVHSDDAFEGYAVDLRDVGLFYDRSTGLFAVDLVFWHDWRPYDGLGRADVSIDIDGDFRTGELGSDYSIEAQFRENDVRARLYHHSGSALTHVADLEWSMDTRSLTVYFERHLLNSPDQFYWQVWLYTSGSDAVPNEGQTRAVGFVPGTEGIPAPHGYWTVSSHGRVDAFGNATGPAFPRSIADLTAPIIDVEETPDGGGYWLLASDGGIFSYYGAGYHGSTGAMNLNRPIVGMARTPTGSGYWLVASDGGVFTFGDAQFFGSTGSLALNEPIVDMAPTPSGAGYWLVARDGGIFAFGDAQFYGSTGATPLAQPIVRMEAVSGVGGYWLLAGDGGVFPFGSAAFHGSGVNRMAAGDRAAGLAALKDGSGYWIGTSSGSVLAFGSASDKGQPSQRHTTGVAAITTRSD